MTLSKKIIIILLIVGLAAIFFSVRTARVHATDIWYQIYQWVVLPLLRIVAAKLDNSLLNQIGNLTGGVLGNSPHFITSWRNNILSSQARGNDLFRSVLADATLCPYFNNGLKAAFGAEKYVGMIASTIVRNSAGQLVYQNQTSIPGLPSFQNLANCTLSSNLNMNTFRNDFTGGGGWATWNQLIQPQNNFFGIYTLALSEQQRQIALENQANINQNTANQGFLPNKIGTVTQGGEASGAAYTACEDKCNADFNSCMAQNSSSQNPSATGQYTAVCSSALTGCDSNCRSSALSAGNATTSANGCLQTLPGTSRCISEGKIVTPGNIFSQASGARISKQITKLQDAQSVGDIIQWLADDVSSRMTSQIDNMLAQDIFGNSIGSGIYSSGTKNPGELGQVNSQVGQSGQAGQAAVCHQQCSDQYNSCNRQNNPALNPSASGNNLSVCTTELNSCDANCPP